VDRFQPEGRDRIAGDEALAEAPMRLFRDLARKLVNVPREELRDQRPRYTTENAAQRERRKRKER
jgi:hypothetical protein